MPKKERRGNGDGSFYTRPDGTVQYRVTVGVDTQGCYIRKSFYGSTKTECRSKYKDYMKSQENGVVSFSPDTTLKKWFVEYLESYRKGSMKDSSYHQLELLRDKIPDSLMNKKVSEIKPIELQKFLNTFAETSSKSYVGKMSSLIRSTFDEATENDLCSKNPARKLKAPQKKQKIRESYTKEEVETIMAFAGEYRRETKSAQLNRAYILISIAIVVLLATGMRRGELLGLMWSDIEDGLIHIRRAVYIKNGVPTATDGQAKTYSSIRDVPVDKEITDMIRSIPKSGLYVFGTHSGRLMNPRNFSRAYDEFFNNLRKEHPEVRKLSPHCCRHTFATLMQKNGTNIRVVQLILGHTNIRTTAGYSHPDQEEMKVASGSYYGYLRGSNKN